MKRILYAAVAALGLLSWTPTAHADPVFDDFGFLDVTFGGDGIPNDAVAISTFEFNGTLVTLGLTAHQRFDNPELTNDGAGTFFAQPGSNFGDEDPALPNPSTNLGARWNYAFFVGTDGSASLDELLLDGLDLILAYDVDPSAATDFGIIDLSLAIFFFGPVGDTLQGSENLLFEFHFDPLNPLLTLPTTITSFDPDAPGIYSFELSATGEESGESVGATAAIDVVVQAIPEPGVLSLAAMLLGLAGIGVARRRGVR